MKEDRQHEIDERVIEAMRRDKAEIGNLREIEAARHGSSELTSKS